MKNLFLVAAIILATVSVARNATAFSTYQSASQNSDGSPKFADPDEQMPNFMVAPDDIETRNRSLSFSAPSTTLPTTGDNDRGAKAFDQAFSHQQDKE